MEVLDVKVRRDAGGAERVEFAIALVSTPAIRALVIKHAVVGHRESEFRVADVLDVLERFARSLS